MKSSLLLSALLFSQLTYANLENSDYATSHNDVIEKSVKKECGSKMKNLEVLTSNETELKVDQGVTNYSYTTTLKAEYEFDQGQFDSYIITVDSSYSDAYNHELGEWGIYYVDSVKCELK